MMDDAKQFAAAVARFVANGCKTTTLAQYAARLAICWPCEHRAGIRCTAKSDTGKTCRCFCVTLAVSAKKDCPLKRWPRLS